MTARRDSSAARPLDAWSRRRAAVRAEAEAEKRKAAEREAEREAARARAALAGKSDAETLAALNLPDPDDLAPGDDFAAFMRAAVPEHLRRRALRKLWLSDPVLANLDDLLDYGEDYTRAPGALETVRTVYKVGRGMLGDEDDDRAADTVAATDGRIDTETGTDTGQALAATRAPDAASDGPHGPGDISDGDSQEAGAAGEASSEAGDPAVAGVPAVADDAAVAAVPADGQATPGPRRRMRFVFEGAASDPDDAPTATPSAGVTARRPGSPNNELDLA